MWHEALRPLAVGAGIAIVGASLHRHDGPFFCTAASISGPYALLFAGTWLVAGLDFERAIHVAGSSPAGPSPRLLAAEPHPGTDGRAWCCPSTRTRRAHLGDNHASFRTATCQPGPA